MEDEVTLSISYDQNICQECGLPLIIYSVEKKEENTDSERIIIKLHCENLEHKAIKNMDFEDYNYLVKNGFDKNCKCTFCNKNFIQLPYYCYACKKIVCVNCFKIHPINHHDKIRKYDELKNVCIIHENCKL